MQSLPIPLMRLLLPLILVSMASPTSAQGTRPAGAESVGFEELFALEVDRAAALEELIPGTEEHYYYRCLEAQHRAAFDEVAPLLATWIERHGRSSRVVEIENRQALLTFDRDPAATYEWLRKRLGLRFNHQRSAGGTQADLPTRLEPQRVSERAFEQLARRRRNDFQGFSARALERQVGKQLNEQLLMDLLRRLERPDLPNLAALVVRNLEDKRSGGFGSLALHGRLLLEQLEECAALRPALLRDDRFVANYLLRLRPGADTEWERDALAREAYLERLWSLVQRL